MSANVSVFALGLFAMTTVRACDPAALSALEALDEPEDAPTGLPEVVYETDVDVLFEVDYQNCPQGADEEVTVHGVSFDDNRGHLLVDVAYDGGCEVQQMALCFSGTHGGPDNPLFLFQVQRDARGDDCGVELSRTLRFDVGTMMAESESSWPYTDGVDWGISGAPVLFVPWDWDD